MVEMASRLLEAFRSRVIDLYPHEESLSGLRRLSIEERLGGYRLVAIRDKQGHCDVAVALSIALPVAMDCLASKVLVEGPPQREPPAIHLYWQQVLQGNVY